MLESWSESLRAKDVDRLLSHYAPEVVYFDVVPPLRHIGAVAVRKNFERWFGGWTGPIGAEVRELSVLGSGDVAVAHMLHRTSGTLKDGRKVGYWVRVTVGCRRADRWLITHEHVSLPVDVMSGRVVMDLEP
jgi:ketosteroid isomerase-like protein